MNRRFVTLLLILGNCLLLCAHNFNISFTKLSSVESGLSQSTVKTLIRDSRGEIWIGTNRGLNRYTLHGLYSYFTSRNDSLSLPNNHILDIIEDKENRIWISTKSGVVTYNRSEDNFTLQTRAIIPAMLQVDDGILLGGENMVLHLYDEGRTDTIRLEEHPDPSAMMDYRLRSMERWGDSRKILVGTLMRGIYILDLDNGKMNKFAEAQPTPLLAVQPATDGRVYASYMDNGFSCYDADGTLLDTYNVQNSNLNNNYIFDILEYKEHLFLATDGGGINIFNPKSKMFYHVLHNSFNNLSTSIPSVTALYRDSYDNFWAGSVREGVLLINNNYIRTFGEAEPGNVNGVSEDAVTCLYEDEKLLWVGTDGGGINLFNPQTNRFKHFKSTFGKKIISLAPFSEKELLVSVFSEGFYLFNTQTGHCRPFLMYTDGGEVKKKMGYVPKAYRISRKEMLLVGNEVYVYHLDSRNFEQVAVEGTGGQTMDVAYQNDQFVLLKNGNRAFRMDIGSHRARMLFEIPDNEEITSMSYDGEKIIWIGTGTGLAYFDFDHPGYHPLNSNHFKYVSYLHFDKYRRLWICAHNMLFSYSLVEKTFTQWNKYDGFMPNEILPNYHRHTNNDYIFMAGARGLVKIDMDIPNPVKYKTEIVLDDVLFNGNSYIGQMEDGEVSIPWNYSSLSVRVNIKNKDIFQRNLLEFKVKGSNEQIVQTENPELTLSALSPGDYKVCVSCYTKNGEYIEPVNLLEIRILPPWYATTTSRLLVLLLFILIVFGIVYGILRRQQKSFKGSVNYFLQALLNKMETKDADASYDAGEETGIVAEPSVEDKAFMEKLDKIIAANISNEEFGVNILAESMNISRASLYNKVKSIVGIGVNDYINKARIERSVYLLTHTDMSISEISYEVGFNYPRYFSTSFKNMKGITPTRFKEENRKKKEAKETGSSDDIPSVKRSR